MSDLIRLVYVSRSTFPPLPAERGVEPSVGRILAESRTNNARRGLVGALYFGDGCFFQCLEGRAEAVDRLYATLQCDPRHTDLKVLSRTAIDTLSFSAWSMKYVPLDASMKELLERLGLSTFDPYRFDDVAVAQVLRLLQAGSDVVPENLGRSPDMPFELRANPDVERALRTARGALAVAIVATVVAIAALVTSAT